MKTKNLFFIILFLFVGSFVYAQETTKSDKMMIRIAEIELHPQFVKEYLAILKEESGASIRLETGVISIVPMFPKEDSTQIRILEIYADKDAYQAHLKTPHFLKYKTSTAHMVKALKLVDMNAIDAEALPLIFRKLN